MKSNKLWYLVMLLVCAMLPLSGCGTTASSPVTEKGTAVQISGVVDAAGSDTILGKLTALASDPIGTVSAINAADSAVLGTASVQADGSFSGLTFSLPASKTIVVFKATVGTAVTYNVTPIDLSNPPTIAASNSIKIMVNAATTAVATTVSKDLGLAGILGDTGNSIPADQNFTTVAAKVTSYGGSILAFTSNGLTLAGSVNASLLPAKDASTLTFEDLTNIRLSGKVVSAFIPSNKPIVNFQVVNKATGKGISGLKSFGLHVAQLKPEANGSNSIWLDYKIEAAGAARDRAFLPGADSGYTVIDHGDGNYTATFGTDVVNNNAYVLSQRDDATKDGAKVVYDSSLVHRIGITVSSASPAAPINPATGAAVTSFSPPNVAALVYDFVPATGSVYVNPNGGNYARDLVTMAACDACHGNLVNHGHHFGSRPDTRICVICHTQQNKRTGEPSADFTPFIHKIHMGEELPVHEVIAGIDVGEITYPQDQRNCTTCHKGKDVDFWKTKPTRTACGSCHNDLAFDAHKGGQTSDSGCAGCHTAAVVIADHATMVPTTNNPTVPTGVDSFSFQITEVTVNTDKHPVIKFKPLKNGAALEFNTYVDATTEMVTGYTSSPSLYAFYARPQDGIDAPADYNVSANATLKNIWAGAATNTLTGPVSGVYTATLNSITIPTDATMVNGGIMSGGFSLTGAEALVDRDLNGDGDKADNYTIPYQSVTKIATGYTARRAIVSNAKCNACHEMLGVKPTFHSGSRNDAPTCQVCHTPNRANTGWAVNSSTFVHGLHAASKRTVPYTWHKELDADGNVEWTGEHITYPGVLRNCELCHIAGTYDYASTAAQVDNMLYTTVASGTGYTTANEYKMSPDVQTGVIYGAAYSGSNATIAPAAETTLVISPISAACYSCHDTAEAKAHMVTNGGSVYEARSTALLKKEACLVCHGPRGSDTTLVPTRAVPTIKSVHRWW